MRLMSYVDRERVPFGSRKALKRVYAYAWAVGGVAVGAAQADRQVSRHARRVLVKRSHCHRRAHTLVPQT